MRYFKMFQRRNQIFDHVKYDLIPENLFDEASEERCWVTIPEQECILRDPNEALFQFKTSTVGLYFFEEKYYEYFKGFGEFIREVFPVSGYPWYPMDEPALDPESDRVLPCYRAARIRLGPVMTRREYEESVSRNKE